MSEVDQSRYPPLEIQSQAKQGIGSGRYRQEDKIDDHQAEISIIDRVLTVLGYYWIDRFNCHLPNKLDNLASSEKFSLY